MHLPFALARSRRLTLLRDCALLLAPVVAACAATPEGNTAPERVASSTNAMNVEASPAQTNYTVTLQNVYVDQANDTSSATHTGVYEDFATLGVSVGGIIPVNNPPLGCDLGPAPAGTTLSSCRYTNGPANAGSLLTQPITVNEESDKVVIAVALDNIEGNSAGALSMSSANLGLVGTTFQSAGSIIGAASGEGAAALFGPAGAVVGVVGGLFSIAGIQESTPSGFYSLCAGGLVQVPSPAYSSWSSFTNDGWANPPLDTLKETYTGEQLEALTAETGSALLTFRVGVQWPLLPNGQPAFVNGAIPAGTCNSAHTINLVVQRVETTGPAASPATATSAVARLSNEVDAFIPDPSVQGIADFALGASGTWSSYAATPSAFSPTLFTPTASISRGRPPLGYGVVAGDTTKGEPATNLQWGLDSFWFDDAATLFWTTYQPDIGWSTTRMNNGGLGVAGGHLTATSRTPTSFDVAWVGPQGQIVVSGTTQNGGKISLNALGTGAGPAGSGIAAVSRTWATSDVLTIGNNGGLLVTSFANGAWGQPTPHGSTQIAPPGAHITAIARDANTIDAFFVGNASGSSTTGPVYQATYFAMARNGQTQGWQMKVVPGAYAPPGAPIAAASRADDIVDLVYQNGNHIQFTELNTGTAQSWTAPVSIQGVTTVSPSADLSLVARDLNDLALVYRGGFGQTYGATWSQEKLFTDWTVTQASMPWWKWVGWDSLNGGLVTDPTAAALNSSQMIAAATGPDGTLWYEIYDGAAWTGWHSLGNGGARLVDAPAIVAANGAIDVFVRDPATGHLLHQHGACGSASSCSAPIWESAGWENLGGTLIAGKPTVVVSQPNNQVNVFATWTDNAAHVISGAGYGTFGGFGGMQCTATFCAFHLWTNLAGGVLSEPGAVSWGPNRLDVFVRGGDNALYQRWSNDNGATWSPANGSWYRLGGSAYSTPSAVSWGVNRIDVFTSSVTQGVDHFAWNGSIWATDVVQGINSSFGGPVAYSRGAGQIDVFVQSSFDGSLQTATMTGYSPASSWSGWSEMTSCFRTNGAPAIASRDGSNLDLFVTAYASNGNASVWHQSTTGGFPTQDVSEPPSCR